MKKNIRKKQGSADGGRRKQQRVLPSNWMGHEHHHQQRGPGDLLKAWGRTVRRREEPKETRPRSRDAADACEATRGTMEMTRRDGGREWQVGVGE